MTSEGHINIILISKKTKAAQTNIFTAQTNKTILPTLGGGPTSQRYITWICMCVSLCVIESYLNILFSSLTRPYPLLWCY